MQNVQIEPPSSASGERVLQGTDAWRAQRLGKVTASRIADLTAKTKSGWSASRANYAAQLVAERLTGVPTDGFKSAAMAWGTEYESEARDFYSFVHGVHVAEVGFVAHPSISMAGASPDGLVEDAGLVEFKAPLTATHIETLLGAKIDQRYLKQVQWQMACTGRLWVDWVSYDPRMPDEMRLHVRRVVRDQVMIAELESQVRDFLAEVAGTVDRLVQMYRMPVAAE